MQDGARELPVAPPPRAIQATARVANRGRPLAGFFLDLLIAIVAMLLLSVACGVAWAIVVGMQVALESGAAFSADDLMQALREPDPVLLIWMTLLSTGTAALLVYFWRRRASQEERAISTQAILKPVTWGWIAVAAVAA